jgi:hypothetical protein
MHRAMPHPLRRTSALGIGIRSHRPLGYAALPLLPLGTDCNGGNIYNFKKKIVKFVANRSNFIQKIAKFAVINNITLKIV